MRLKAKKRWSQVNKPTCFICCDWRVKLNRKTVCADRGEICGDQIDRIGIMFQGCLYWLLFGTFVTVLVVVDVMFTTVRMSMIVTMVMTMRLVTVLVVRRSSHMNVRPTVA